MFILDFLCIHPFNDGNGRMSRLLTLLLLYRSGYIVGSFHQTPGFQTLLNLLETLQRELREL